MFPGGSCCQLLLRFKVFSPHVLLKVQSFIGSLTISQEEHIIRVQDALQGSKLDIMHMRSVFVQKTVDKML